MLRPFIALLVLLMLMPSIATAQTAPPLPAVPAQQIGDLTVRKYGKGKQAVILIPGLACGAWVWDQTVRDFQGSYTLYTVTLAGFDGTKPLPIKMLYWIKM